MKSKSFLISTIVLFMDSDISKYYSVVSVQMQVSAPFISSKSISEKQ